MPYRNIEVNGVKYKYVTGKTHTKVVGVGVVLNTDIASTHKQPIKPCGCPECDCDVTEYIDVKRVTPKDVAEYIKEEGVMK